MSYEKFEKIYEYDGVPITLFEIEEWWEQAPRESRGSLSSPYNDEASRLKIAEIIVKNMSAVGSQKFDILRNFKKRTAQVRENFGIFFDKRINGVGYKKDEDFSHIEQQDAVDMGYADVYESPRPTSPRRNYSGGYRRRDLPPIPDGENIFQQAIRMANAKAQEEQQRQQAQYAYQKWQREQAQIKANPPRIVGWREVLGFSDGEKISKEDLNKRFREKAKSSHPDHGGKAEDFQKFIEARDSALKEII